MGLRAWMLVLLLAGPGLLQAPAVMAEETDAERNQRLEEKLKRLEQRQRNEEAARKKAASQPKPVTKPAAAPKPRQGTLVLTADAPCTLNIDGEALGTLGDTPRTVQVPPGEMLVQCDSTERSGVRARQTRKVADGEKLVVTLELAGQVRTGREAEDRIEQGRKAAPEREQALVPAVTIKAAVATPEEERAYLAAFDLAKSGKYDEAIKGFRSLVVQWPQGPYSDNAWYWMGEVQTVKRDYVGATTSFQYLTDKFPTSPKIADGLYKLGLSQLELKRNGEARTTLQRVVREYPETNAATLARKKLDQIGG